MLKSNATVLPKNRDEYRWPKRRLRERPWAACVSGRDDGHRADLDLGFDFTVEE
jgi:hypothetical protein